MKWQKIIERLQTAQTVEGLSQDPFHYLGAVPGPKARITYGVSRSIEYGAIKCSVTVAIDCPQNEEHMNIAAEIAYDKAVELVNDGFGSIVPDAIPIARSYE